MTDSYTRSVVKHAKSIVYGRVLAIDPSSGSAGSMPGFALYELGKFRQHGVLQLNHKRPIQYRLAELYKKIDELGAIDVLIVERIRGTKSHEYLHWAVGVTVAASGAPVVLEIPTTVWKQYAKHVTTYTKSDDADALMMLGATVHIAIHGRLTNGQIGRTKKRAKGHNHKTRATRA